MKISICMATYNGEKYIKDQLVSIINQINIDDEIIISDDNSNDNTVNIINQFKDNRIKIIYNRKKGHITNFENAMNQATGDFIFLTDQDDVWLDNKVVAMKEKLNRNSLVASDCFIVNKDLEVIKESFFSNRKIDGFFNNFFKNKYVGCCLAFKKEMLQYILPFPPKIKSHDMWIGLICELFGNTYILKERLIYLRRHGENFSASKTDDTFLSNRSPYSFISILKDRAYIGFHLFFRFLKFKKINSKKRYICV